MSKNHSSLLHFHSFRGSFSQYPKGGVLGGVRKFSEFPVDFSGERSCGRGSEGSEGRKPETAGNPQCKLLLLLTAVAAEVTNTGDRGVWVGWVEHPSGREGRFWDWGFLAGSASGFCQGLNLKILMFFKGFSWFFFKVFLNF